MVEIIGTLYEMEGVSKVKVFFISNGSQHEIFFFLLFFTFLLPPIVIAWKSLNLRDNPPYNVSLKIRKKYQMYKIFISVNGYF